MLYISPLLFYTCPSHGPTSASSRPRPRPCLCPQYVEFKAPFMCEGAVEDWLNGLVDIMRDTLRMVLEKSKEVAETWSPEAPRTQWVYDFCAQVRVERSRVQHTRIYFFL